MWSDGIWVVWGMEHLMVLITHKYRDSPRLWEGLQPTSILLDWFYSIRTHLFFNSRWLWAWLLSEQTDHKELAVKGSKVKQGEEMVKSLQPYMVKLYLVNLIWCTDWWWRKASTFHSNIWFCVVHVSIFSKAGSLNVVDHIQQWEDTTYFEAATGFTWHVVWYPMTRDIFDHINNALLHVTALCWTL